MLTHLIAFDVQNPPWSEIPSAPGVFALFGADEKAQPYMNRTPDLRRRLKRLLEPRPNESSVPSKRLQLAARVQRIGYTPTGSDFESLLCLYRTARYWTGEQAAKQLHLRAPIFLRLSMENPFPRVYLAKRITLKASADLFGPFPSRWLAERWTEQMLNLFLLRRCPDDLAPHPEHPGCIYSELKKCLAPCYEGCTEEQYRAEANAVHAFLSTRGASLRAQLEAERETASEALDFEQAAQIHARLVRVEEVIGALPEAVRPLPQLEALIVQPALAPETVSLFLLAAGQLVGPVPFSTHGMRHANEQSGSSSLFAHPTMLAPVPLAPKASTGPKRNELDERLEAALTELRGQREPASSTLLADHLALFRRWFYRPQTQRKGEIIFAQPETQPEPEKTALKIPLKAAQRAISRVYQASATQRAAGQAPAAQRTGQAAEQTAGQMAAEQATGQKTEQETEQA